MTTEQTQTQNQSIESQSRRLEELAAQFNAAILVDKDGHYALQERWYDEEEKMIVRHCPSNGDFYPLNEWTKFSRPEHYIC